MQECRLASAQPTPSLPSHNQLHLPAALPGVGSIALGCPSADMAEPRGQLLSAGLFPVHWFHSKLMALWTKTPAAAAFPGKEWYVWVTLQAFGFRFYIKPADLQFSGVTSCWFKG